MKFSNPLRSNFAARLLMLLIALSFTLGCSSDDDDSNNTQLTTPDEKGDADDTWTIFVYGHADHNLTPSLVQDVEEMKAATFGANMNVIVYADFQASEKNQIPTGALWAKISPGVDETLSIEEEQNFDDPAVLQAAVTKAFTDFPADRYGIVMWNHGGSWTGGFGGDSNDGAGHGAGILIPDLAESIRNGMDAANVEELAFLSFDTCLLAGAESAAEFKDTTQVFIASAEIDFGRGWDYEATLSWLDKNRGASSAEFAKAEVGFWSAHHADDDPNDRDLKTQIAIDMTKFARFESEMAKLLEVAKSNPQPLVAAAAKAVPAFGQTGRPNDYHIRDVGQVLTSLVNDADFGGPASKALDALKAMTIEKTLGKKRAANGQFAFTVEIPSAAEINTMNSDYSVKAAAWSEATSWSSLFAAISGGNDNQAPDITFGAQSDVVTADDPATVSVGSDASDISEFVAVVGYEENGEIVVLDTLASGLLEMGESYQIEWEGELPLLGGTAIYTEPYAFDGTVSESNYLSVPGEFEWEFGTEDATLLLDEGELVGVIVSEDGRSALFEIEEFEGAIFYPMAPVLTDTGTEFIVSDSEIEIVAGLTLEYELAPADFYVILGFASDIWGNVTTESVEIEVQ